MSDSREFWFDALTTDDPNLLSVSKVYLKEPDHRADYHVIDMIAYNNLEAKYNELLSYLPKVPTEPYEKEMAKKIVELEARLKVAEQDRDSLKHRTLRGLLDLRPQAVHPATWMDVIDALSDIMDDQINQPGPGEDK